MTRKSRRGIRPPSGGTYGRPRPPKGPDGKPSRNNLSSAPARVRDIVPSGHTWINGYKIDPAMGNRVVFLDTSRRVDAPSKEDMLDGKPNPYSRRVVSVRTTLPRIPVSVNSDAFRALENKVMYGRCSPNRMYVEAFLDLQSQLKLVGAEMGMNIATYKQTIDLMGDIALRVSEGYRHLRRGDVYNAFRSLGDGRAGKRARQQYERLERARRRARSRVRRRGKRGRASRVDTYIQQPNGQYRRADRNMSNDYLAYTYGVEPLIGDLDRLINGNDGADLSFPVKGRYFARDSYYDNYKWGSKGEFREEWANSQFGVEIGTTVLVDDPNKRALEDYGLYNPLLVVNDLIPFSFVLNWFTRHEAWLASLTMWAGLKRKNEYWTWWGNVEAGENAASVLRYGEDPVSYSRLFQSFVMERKVQAVRTPGLSEFTRLFPFSSKRRTANALTLVHSLITSAERRTK